MFNNKKYLLIIFIMVALFVIISVFAISKTHKKINVHPTKSKIKLYWFIPDGLRAEDEIFKIFEWANSDELPNIHQMMLKGSYGYSRPVFPSHTPTNFATLMTGEYPDVHGVADGAMRHLGFPLSTVFKGGFSSSAKLMPSI